ncbi:MAG: carbohydrate ABC transporter permease [Nitrospirota bacterium]
MTWTVACALCLVYVAPVAIMVVGSLKPDARVLVEAGSWRAFHAAGASLANYGDVFARVDLARFLFNSLFITTSVVVLGLVVNSLAGYAFARLVWRGRRCIFAAVTALMVLPFEAIAVPLFYGANLLGLRDTYTVQIVPFVANAFAIYLFYSFFLGLPRELEEAARIDGAGTLRTFVEVVAPNARPCFATVAILTFLTQWGSYLWPLLVTAGPKVRPLPVAIAAFYTLPPRQWGDILAFGVVMAAPVVVLFLLFQRAFVRGVATTGVKG